MVFAGSLSGMPLRPFFSTPLLLGSGCGSALQLGMKVAGADSSARVGVQVACMGISALGVFLYPPGGPDTAENWMWFIVCGTLFATGAFGLLMGASLNAFGSAAASSGTLMLFALCVVCRIGWLMLRVR
jgi:hypothetical protein